ncbi:SRPBCC family protein [Paenibacillus sp. GCM10027627]|uniref:SRPBCC family protein n=1 Tax=unclassified Paenibacillus TaxID=185978 RepID=UPI00362D212D
MAVNLNEMPVVQAEMLIRRSANEVYEAFVDPAVTTRFWFTRSSGRLEQGSTVRWEWEMYGAVDEVMVLELVPNERIKIESSDGTKVEWTFAELAEQETYVTIKNWGFSGSGDEVVGQALDSMGGYTMVLCGVKALLEHGISLNLVADKAPDAHIGQ